MSHPDARSALDRAYGRWAQGNNLEVRVSADVSAESIRVSAGAPLDEDPALWVEVDTSPGHMTYVDYSHDAAVSRLDAPLLEVLVAMAPNLKVTLPMPGLPPTAPSQLARVVIDLEGLERSRSGGPVAVRATVASGALGTCYDLTLPIGVYDLTSVLEDALLLADPASEALCLGPHDEGDPAPGAPVDGRLREALLFTYPLCEKCAHMLAAMNAPLAPKTPKEWE